jgi:uncharacterized membrane protein
MLGTIRLAPAILFYLLYVVGILIFVSGQAGATWQSTMLYGALFGFLRDLRTHVAVAAQALDLVGGHGRCDLGAFVTAVSSTTGLMIANWIARKI